MTTLTDKDLLLRDLSARLPYGVEVKYDNSICEVLSIDTYNEEVTIWKSSGNSPKVKLEKVKPFLFPLSSMTEEQFHELKEITDFKYNRNNLELVEWTKTHKTIEFWLEEVPQYKVVEVFDWLNKNHFDYRCLIEEGLAIDATELNIYC